MGEKTVWLPGQTFKVSLVDSSIYANRCGVENGNTGVVQAPRSEAGYYCATIQTIKGFVKDFFIHQNDMAPCTKNPRQGELDKAIAERYTPAKPKVGSVVSLKSGGPWVTVKSNSITGEYADVQWFDEGNKLQSGSIPWASLNCKVV